MPDEESEKHHHHHHHHHREYHAHGENKYHGGDGRVHKEGKGRYLPIYPSIPPTAWYPRGWVFRKKQRDPNAQKFGNRLPRNMNPLLLGAGVVAFVLVCLLLVKLAGG